MPTTQTTLYGDKVPDEKDLPKPFLKWAGGKTQLLDELVDHLPSEINDPNKIKKYFEPFVGGGALFFYLKFHYPHIEEFYLSDMNKELILTYKVIQNDPTALIERLRDLSDCYIKKTKHEKKEFYYEIRENFNKTLIYFDHENYSKEHIERASQMIFLNKTCFNGLFRVNKKGEFNVPFAYPENPLICDENNILNVSKALKDVKIKTASYLESEQFIDDKSLVYLDPPYRPLNKKSSFEGYSKLDFDDDSQIELAKYCEKISNKGAKVLLSNSDPHNTDKDDDFFDDLYEEIGFTIDRVYANRSINSKGDKRGPITEILVQNF